MQYPEVMAAFIAQGKRTDAYFYAPETVVKRDVEYVKLKTFIYYLLNFHEEIYFILQDQSLAKRIEGEVLLDCIVLRMRHPLLREVFKHEGDRIYTSKFASYLRSRSCEMNQPWEPDIW